MVLHQHRLAVAAATVLAVASFDAAQSPATEELWRDVEVIRTEHGVAHIRARTLRAGAYGLAWVQLEDYGPRTAMTILRMSGRMAPVFGHDSIEHDFAAWRDRRRVMETWHQLEEATRDVYEGFALGINRFVELHSDRFPPGMPRFSGYDIAVLDLGGTTAGAIRAYGRLLESAGRRDSGRTGAADDGNVGSNGVHGHPARVLGARVWTEPGLDVALVRGSGRTFRAR